MSWTGIARMWEAAQATDEARRSFQNSVLGETWIETGEAPDWQRLYERREAWRIGTVPGGGLFLTAGADVQKDRIEVSIWAWGRGLTSWLVDHIVIAGGPERQASWGELTSLLGRTWPHAHGARLGIAKLAVDTGYQAPPSMRGRAGPGLPRSPRSRLSRGSTGPRRSPARALSMRRNAAARSAVVRGFGRSPSRPSSPRPIAISG